MKVAFYTLGCKVNNYETTAIQNEFIKKDFEIVNFDTIADVYVINTCAVTKQSDKKSRQMIRRARKLNENAIIVACGCSTEVLKDDNSFSQADIIIGSANKTNIANIVIDYSKDKKKYIFDTSIDEIKEFEHMSVLSFQNKTRASIKIEDGCDNYCAYCIIPFVRGSVRSKPIEKALSEINELAKNGYQEIVLTGIHLTSYGKDLDNINLINLIEKIGEIKGIERLRLGSLEPTYLNEKIVKRIKKIKSLCPHFHLSLQSGCDETLIRMGRKYTTCEYEKEVKLLREHFPNCSITTDIMTGFPNETEKEFNESFEFFKKIHFSNAHIFTYSRRKGTKADIMPNQVDENIKINRARILLEQSKTDKQNYLKLQIGKKNDILFENTYKNGFYEGYTSNYILVKVKSDLDVRKSFKNVEILQVKEDFCIGQII